jgi:hypothetical protein
MLRFSRDGFKKTPLGHEKGPSGRPLPVEKIAAKPRSICCDIGLKAKISAYSLKK